MQNCTSLNYSLSMVVICMSKSPNIPISKMNYEQLRDTVQLLSDELALFKHKYEDSINNLDYNNMSAVLIKEKDTMKAQITVTADAIKTMVSDTDLQLELEKYSTIEQTAEEIELAVIRLDASTDNKLKEYSTITQMADKISMAVNAAFSNPEEVEYFDETVADEGIVYYEKSSELYWYYDGNAWEGSIKANFGSVFTQTTDGFVLDGKKAIFTGVIYLTDNGGNSKFAITHDESQDYGESVTIRGTSADSYPIIMGDYSNNVYIGTYADGHLVATQGWVEEYFAGGSGSGYAVFG